jgi:kynurenine formamidase
VSNLPRYRELPIAAGLPPRSAWNVFGLDDDAGTLNLLTPELVRGAASLVRSGQVFPLNWRLDRPRPAIMGRKGLQRIQLNYESGAPASDDYFQMFYPQSSSQWDALKHCGNAEYGFYNGHSAEEVLAAGSCVLGIHSIAQRGIVGRFVLLDIDRYFAAESRPLSQTERVEITPQDLEGALRHQNVSLAGGDVLLIRFGWVRWYEQLDETERADLATKPMFPSPGLSAGTETEEWLWDNHIAVLATDNPMVEAMPADPDQLHYRVIPLLGMTIGEMFFLDDLAADCVETSVFEGMFAAAPLNIVGGSGSTANALAIK